MPGPEILRLPLIAGKAEASVIVPETVKDKVMGLVDELASRIACLNEPGPESATVETATIWDDPENGNERRRRVILRVQIPIIFMTK